MLLLWLTYPGQRLDRYKNLYQHWFVMFVFRLKYKPLPLIDTPLYATMWNCWTCGVSKPLQLAVWGGKWELKKPLFLIQFTPNTPMRYCCIAASGRPRLAIITDTEAAVLYDHNSVFMNNIIQLAIRSTFHAVKYKLSVPWCTWLAVWLWLVIVTHCILYDLL